MNIIEKSKILIVDDEQNILRALKRLFRSAPYEIFTCTTPEDAIAMSLEQEFDAILSDYRMPSMNGIDMFKKINEKQPDAVKIILSGYTDLEVIINGLNKEYVNKYILKPWNEENLKIEIEKSVNHCRLVKSNRKLQQEVISQNEKLKKINEKLEEMVEERTRKLQLRNRVLMRSQAVLNRIPIPVIGVDKSLLVALTNEAANSIFPYIVIGEKWPVLEFVPFMKKAMNENMDISVTDPELIEKYGNIIVSPMDNGKSGVVVTFISNLKKCYI